MLGYAYQQATHSHDPRTQNGAVIIQDEGLSSFMVAVGYNHVPNLENESLLQVREWKHKRVVHAEVAALVDAANRGQAVRGLTLVCPWASCLGCAAAIQAAGIGKLVVHKQRMAIESERWDGEIKEAHAWLLRAGVRVVVYDGPVHFGWPIRVNGDLWTP